MSLKCLTSQLWPLQLPQAVQQRPSPNLRSSPRLPRTKVKEAPKAEVRTRRVDRLQLKVLQLLVVLLAKPVLVVQLPTLMSVESPMARNRTSVSGTLK